LLVERGVRTVTTEGWRSIDKAEKALGASRDRPRTTIHEVSSMLAIAGG